MNWLISNEQVTKFVNEYFNFYKTIIKRVFGRKLTITYVIICNYFHFIQDTPYGIKITK